MQRSNAKRIALLAFAFLLAATVQAAPVAAKAPDAGEPEAVPERRESAGDQPAAEGRDMPGTGERAADEQGADERQNRGTERPGTGDRPGMPKPGLTRKQQKELARLYKDLYATQKKVIGKYAEFGVITREQASLWLDRLEARYEKLKASGYVPAWKKCHRPKAPGMTG